MGQCQKNNRLAFAADPVLLAELLRAMIPLIDESTQRVEFLVGDKPGKPVLVKGFNPSLCVEGLIMPWQPGNRSETETRPRNPRGLPRWRSGWGRCLRPAPPGTVRPAPVSARPLSRRERLQGV
jgi:hypothetical protein